MRRRCGRRFVASPWRAQAVPGAVWIGTAQPRCAAAADTVVDFLPAPTSPGDRRTKIRAPAKPKVDRRTTKRRWPCTRVQNLHARGTQGGLPADLFGRAQSGRRCLQPTARTADQRRQGLEKGDAKEQKPLGRIEKIAACLPSTPPAAKNPDQAGAETSCSRSGLRTPRRAIRYVTTGADRAGTD